MWTLVAEQFMQHGKKYVVKEATSFHLISSGPTTQHSGRVPSFPFFFVQRLNPFQILFNNLLNISLMAKSKTHCTSIIENGSKNKNAMKNF
ncbi:hypothetical protein RIF29_08010 [Crotalaria pallida]|uniref:Uncharacterized protein n=1 Tax=Crotalaria pallida TaxID=3830 RepID=A0AAN9PB34_CROPI